MAGRSRAGGPRASIAWSAARSSWSGTARRDRRCVRVRDRGRPPHRARRVVTARVGGAIHVEETAPSRRARGRPARRHRPRVPARSRAAGMGRDRTPRDVPRSPAERAARPLGVQRGGRRHARTSGRRRTAAAPGSAGCPSRTRTGAAASARAGAAAARSPPRTIALTDLETATHDVDLIPRPETIVHLDIAHRGSRHGQLRPGHARAVSRRSRHVSLVVDAAGHPVTIEFRSDERQFHLHDDTISLVLRVYEDGQLGHLHLGAPLPLGRSYRHLGPDPFPGFDGRVGDPVPMAYPTSGIGDFRVPAVVVRGADGTTTLALRYRDHRITVRQAGAARPALDLHRIRRRGRDARGHPRRRPRRRSRWTSGARSSAAARRSPAARPCATPAQRPSRSGRR